MSWQAVATTEELVSKGRICIKLGHQQVLLVWHNQQAYALENRCSHASKPLTEGKIEDCAIRCPYHGASFSLEDGSHLSPPAFKGIAVFPTREQNKQIEIFFDK